MPHVRNVSNQQQDLVLVRHESRKELRDLRRTCKNRSSENEDIEDPREQREQKMRGSLDALRSNNLPSKTRQTHERQKTILYVHTKIKGIQVAIKSDRVAPI
ncbi:hypothetical protein P7K49_020733 [Saguinus oedipus]|uniref:Uncharacterized protein n=1 Tax=Saguinus oedipus TaxID=9490 RepID=A0ABQ9V1F2_SAGOE|nr:hypothetical protein P7K49_020733 [Saguinus oedipus]